MAMPPEGESLLDHHVPQVCPNANYHLLLGLHDVDEVVDWLLWTGSHTGHRVGSSRELCDLSAPGFLNLSRTTPCRVMRHGPPLEIKIRALMLHRKIQIYREMPTEVRVVRP